MCLQLASWNADERWFAIARVREPLYDDTVGRTPSVWRLAMLVNPSRKAIVIH